MTYFVVGLGNTGEEYKSTRHNVGREAVEYFVKAHEGDFKASPKKASLVAKVATAPEKGEKGKKGVVQAILPETFMNTSGKAVAEFVTSKAVAQKSLIVVHDDLDLALGTVKVCANKSAGGHKGVESVIKAVKTQEFIRIRIGITPTDAKGKLKKPDHDKLIDGFIVHPFKADEVAVITKARKAISESIRLISTLGYEHALNIINSKVLR